jgi:hypothetical protein
MTTLLYRGHAYQQVKDADQQQGVQLTYRRNVYQARQADVRQSRVQLTYRGVSYLR